MFIVATLCITAFFVFMYHYERNGNPWPIGDTFERLLWALVFALGCPILGWVHGAPPIPSIAAMFFVTQFIAMLIPHAFAQNAGFRVITWAQQPWTKWWPGAAFYYVKNFFAQDFLGMMCVGALRGAIVFLPTIALGASPVGAIAAAVTTMLWQPCAYWLGYRTPWTMWTNTANSSRWGEFFVPIGWAVALAVSILC